MTAPICPEEMLFQYLSSNGDGTGTVNLTGDYSLGATDFFIQPPADEFYAIEKLVVIIEDNSKISADKYGGLAALTNGIILTIFRDATPSIVLTQSQPITSNAEWAGFTGKVIDHTYGTGNEFLTVEWDFRDTGRSVLLEGPKLDKLTVTLEDNLASLITHRFFVHGVKAKDYIGRKPGWHVD